MEEFLKNCKISKPLINAIKTLGYTSPTAVQKECIPLILSGQEVSAKAPTGTGKTAAFAIPIIELLSRDPYSIFSVIITPTRELALQINDQFQAFGSLVKLKAMCITGGVDIVNTDYFFVINQAACCYSNSWQAELFIATSRCKRLV